MTSTPVRGRPPASTLESAVLRIVADLVRQPVSGQSLLDMPWAALGLDSLDLLELAVRCEDEVGRSIPDAELLRWSAPRQVVAYLESL
jgi:acyl carrier protein